ncbi:MAG: cyclic nucleotide-binding domain-containing protein [candidate division NC10 bacterium]|nr:cyclic nucleotide-binding domain-containing protein [candidate division NC10 bacterium]
MENKGARRLAFFRGFNDQDFDAIWAKAQMVAYRDGEILIARGKPRRAFYIPLEGKLQVVKRCRGGKAQTLAVIYPGEPCGFCFLSEGPAYASIVSLGPSVVLEMDRSGFEGLMRETPSLAFAILTKLLDASVVHIGQLYEQVLMLRELYLDAVNNELVPSSGAAWRPRGSG